MTPQLDRSFWSVVIASECSEVSNDVKPVPGPPKTAVRILPRIKEDQNLQPTPGVSSVNVRRGASPSSSPVTDININEAAQHLIALHQQKHVRVDNANDSRKVRYECEQCKALFRRKSYLRKHVAAVHNKLKPYRCNLCDRPFGYRGALAKHFRTIHLGEKPFVCPGKNCTMRFSERGNLKKHFGNKHSKEGSE